MIVAVDIDLRKMTAVCSSRGVLVNRADPADAHFEPGPEAQIIVEIGGPVMHHAESHSFRRWLIYNVAIASQITSAYPNALVANSTTWTHGYSEENRQAVAGIHRNAKGKYAENHDVRECRAMIYFFRKAPHLWKSLPDYLAGLT